MSKQCTASDEVIIKAVRQCVRPSGDGPLSWAHLADIKAKLPDEPNLLERLQQLTVNGPLVMTYDWMNHAPTEIVGVDPVVGYNKNRPRFRVL